MAVLKTTEDILSADLAPGAAPVLVDGNVPPLAARSQQTGWTVAALLTAMRTASDPWASALNSIASYVLCGPPTGGTIPPITGAPTDAVGAIYLPAGPNYTVNVSTDTPAFWIRLA